MRNTIQTYKLNGTSDVFAIICSAMNDIYLANMYCIRSSYDNTVTTTKELYEKYYKKLKSSWNFTSYTIRSVIFNVQSIRRKMIRYNLAKPIGLSKYYYKFNKDGLLRIKDNKILLTIYSNTSPLVIDIDESIVENIKNYNIDPILVVDIKRKKIYIVYKTKNDKSEKKEVSLLQCNKNEYRVEKYVDNEMEEKYVVMIDIGDIHMGKHIKNNEVRWVKKYDKEIFEKQVYKFFDEVKKYIEMEENSFGRKISAIVINTLGDLVDGEAIYPGHSREVEANIQEQIYNYGDFLYYNFVKKISELGIKTHIKMVPGNHGRIGRIRGEMISQSNFDNFLADYWIGLVKSSNFQEKIIIEKSIGTYMIYELLNEYHMICHGNEMGTSIENPILSAKKLIGRILPAEDVKISYIHMGHIHRMGYVEFSKLTVLLNGGWVGPTKFSQNQLHCSDRPAQRIITLGYSGIKRIHSIELDDHLKKGKISIVEV